MDLPDLEEGSDEGLDEDEELLDLSDGEVALCFGVPSFRSCVLPGG